MKNLKYLILFAFVALVASCNDSDKGDNPPAPANKPLLPQKELRGVWIATVWGLDWPMGDYHSVSQKKKYTDYLDLFVEHNINAVFFQIRGMADAFYDSKYESWSKYLTGSAGKEPDYDVLNFLIDEAHKRGIQFHAWLNPYRISTRVNASASFPDLDPKIPKELTKDYEKIRIYNPALPEVQTRITDIVKEIITKYNVDGIHLDDYFYPSLAGGETMNDDEEYEKYGKSQFDKIADFRRNNVNTVVRNIQKTIIETRPEVIYSISPAGNNDNNYHVLFADVVKWTQEGWVDMLIPQLYFATGTGESNFNRRLDWWSQFTYNSHLLIGYGIYKFGDPKAGDKFQTSEDLKSQFALAAAKKKVKGSVLYSAKYLTENRVGITDAIKEIYNKRVLLPYLGRTKAELPATPVRLKLNGDNLSWSTVEGAVSYAIYKDNGKEQTATLIDTTKDVSFRLSAKGTYFVTAIGKDNAESDLSELVTY